MTHVTIKLTRMQADAVMDALHFYAEEGIAESGCAKEKIAVDMAYVKIANAMHLAAPEGGAE